MVEGNVTPPTVTCPSWRSERGYTGQNVASAMKEKIMETPPMENKTRSDIACPLGCCNMSRGSEGGVKVEMLRKVQNRPKRAPSRPAGFIRKPRPVWARRLPSILILV